MAQEHATLHARMANPAVILPAAMKALHGPGVVWGTGDGVA